MRQPILKFSFSKSVILKSKPCQFSSEERIILLILCKPLPCSEMLVVKGGALCNKQKRLEFSLSNNPRTATALNNHAFHCT